MSQTFTDYDAWVSACNAHGYQGPFQIQGFRSFQFVDSAGTAAIWNDDTGQIFARATIVTDDELTEDG